MVSEKWTEPADAYGWSAVVRNVVPFFALLMLAPALQAAAPIAPWLLAPLIGLSAYRITIVMHDCIHRTLLKDAKLNVFLGRLLGAVTGIDFHCFSTQHLRHHRTYGEPADPQGFQYLGLKGSSRLEFAWHVLKPLLGFNLRYALKESLLNPANLRQASRTRDLLALVATQALILAIVTGAGAYWWLAPLPFVSSATFGLFFSQLRGMAEHAAIGDAKEAGRVRSHAPDWLDSVLLYDLNFNYHAEHHLHPQYASCHLPAVHRELRAAHEELAPSMFRTIASLPSV